MHFLRILNLFFPNDCCICGKKIKYDSFACENCLNILKYCRVKTIKPLGKYYDEQISLFKYDKIIKELILKLKFKEKRYLSVFFASIMFDRIKKYNVKFDIIVPVPISFKRYLERGYNQSLDIAGILSKLTGKMLCSNALKKIKHNKAQSSLHRNDRIKNVHGVYAIKRNMSINGRVVLLLDDIFTTGATANECAKMLKKAGASKVVVLTIAYA